MAEAHQAVRSDLERKMCLSCGHRGRHLQGEKGLITVQCPACGADLYARPPRSYAELEGFIPPTPRRISVAAPPHARPPEAPATSARLAERAIFWSIGLVFIAVSGAGILATLI